MICEEKTGLLLSVAVCRHRHVAVRLERRKTNKVEDNILWIFAYSKGITYLCGIIFIIRNNTGL